MQIFRMAALGLALFPIENGDNYEESSLSERPDVFSDVLPDFEKPGYTLFSDTVMLKNGEPVSFEGHYPASGDTVDDIHWCLTPNPTHMISSAASDRSRS